MRIKLEFKGKVFLDSSDVRKVKILYAEAESETVFWSLVGLLVAVYLGLWMLRVLALVWMKAVVGKHEKMGQNEKDMLLLRNNPDGRFPGVSIIKPLLGRDPYLERNLKTFFTQNYPQDRFEILFCVQDVDDPAVGVVEDLIESFPAIDARLFTGHADLLVNPKTNNILPAWKAARFNLVLLSDSGMMFRARTLQNVVLSMTPQTGLVHQMPFVEGREELGFSAALEKWFFGGNFAQIYFLADYFGVNCAGGCSCLVRKHIIDSYGGISAFSNTLSEDYFIAQAITNAGWKVKLASEPGHQRQGNSSPLVFFERLYRWQKLRAFMLPLTYFVELLLEPTWTCLFFSIAFWYLFGTLPPGSFIVFHFLSRICFDLLSIRILDEGRKWQVRWMDLFSAWVVRDCSQPVIWFSILFSRHITWKKKTYKLFLFSGKTQRVVD